MYQVVFTFPQKSYRIPPNGGATRHPNEMKAKAMPRALERSDSSVYLKIDSVLYK